MKWPSAAQAKAGAINGSTGRLFRSDFYTSVRPSRIYATAVFEAFDDDGTVEHGISRRRHPDGRSAFDGWVRVGNGPWVSIDAVYELSDYFLVDSGDPDSDPPTPMRFEPERVARIEGFDGYKTWVERRETGYRVEWIEEGSVRSMPLQAALQVVRSELFAEVSLAAMAVALGGAKLTIAQVARAVRAQLPVTQKVLRDEATRAAQ